MVMTRSTITQILQEHIQPDLQRGPVFSVYQIEGVIAEVLHSIFDSVNPIAFLSIDPVAGIALKNLAEVRVSGSVLLTASICDGMFNIHTVCFQMLYDAQNKIVQVQNIY